MRRAFAWLIPDASVNLRCEEKNGRRTCFVILREPMAQSLFLRWNRIFLTVLILKTNYSLSFREIRVPLRPSRILAKRGAARRIEEIKNN